VFGGARGPIRREGGFAMLSLFTATKHSKRSAAIGAIVAIALGASTVIVAAPAMAVANDGSVTVTSATPVAAPTSTITLTIKVHCPDKGADSNNAQSLTADITSSSGAGVAGIDVEGTGVATPPNDWTLTADVNTPDTLGPVDYTVTVSGRLCVDTPKSATVTVLVAGLPDAPSNLAADVTGDSTATVSFTPPADNGSAITVYEWTIDGGQTVASAGATSPMVITGLPNGIASPLQLRAVNGAGPGAWSAPINVTPVGVPEPVTNLTAIANDRSLDVSFNAPVSDGGFAITTYEYSIDGGAQFTSWASTLTAQTISGLTNGTSYAVVVRARNSQGGGKLSATVNATPVGVPDSPTNVQAVAGDKSVTVSFAPPASNGGLPITEYRYSTDGINFVIAAQSSSPITITTDSADGVSPLVNLTTYTVQIVAVNALGPSAPSTAVPATPGTTVPDAPIVTAVLHGDSVLGAMFTVGSAGGLPITDLQYRIGLAGLPTSTDLVDGIAVINGLTNGTSYDVYLRVGNANGYSAWSNVGTGTPSTTAGPPTITSIAGADAALVVSFTAPADNGSASISDYEYSTDAGATWLTTGTTASPITISNASDGSGALSNSQTYQVLLRAVNLNGSGLPSNQVAATPLEATATSIVCAAATYTGSALTPCTVTVSAVTGLTLHPTASYSNNTAAGTATASYTYPGDSTHLGSTATVTFTIDKASSTSTVTCNPSTITYTGSAFTPCSVSVTGAGGLNTTGTVVYSNNTSAGTATASYDYPGDSNHNVSTGSTTFTIAQAAVTVTASTSSITYPSAAPTVTFTTNPALTSGDWTTLPTCDVYASGDTGFATPLSGTQNAGTYATHCSGGVSVNYAATYTNGVLTITKANATVIADTTSITYGTDVPAATFTTSPSPITWTAQPTCATYSTSDTFFVTPLTGLHSAGTYITHCTGGTSANYTPTAYTNGVLTISQANATVIAASPSITYGASVPAVSFTTNPTPITWTTNPTCATYSTSDTGFTSALTGVHSVGTYVTHCTGGASVNYAPTTYTDGVLTISQANATVIAASPSITYGTSVPAVSFTTNPTPITWITDPTCSVYTTADTSFSSALAGVQDAGTYLTHCTGGTSVNYTPTTYTNGVLTITKANATVIADTTSITYGTDVPAATFTTSPSPITWTAQPTCATYSTSDTFFVTPLTGLHSAGTYITHCTGGTSANYTPTAYTNGVLTISQANATVIAASPSITYGASVPAVSFTTNPTPITWTTNPTCATYSTSDTGFTSALTGVHSVGTYVTHCTGGASVNYAPTTYTDGVLTISQANATVIAASPSITYGTSVPAVSFTTNPTPITWITDPTCSVYTTADTSFSSALAGVQDAGTYLTHCTGGTSVNYTPTTYTNGVLTITKANATVIAASPSINYGFAVPAVTFTTSPTPITWTTNPTCGVYATTDTGFVTRLTGVQNAGTYVTHCSGGVSANYTPTAYTNGVLTINKANATVTASSPASITYGSVVPSFSFGTILTGGPGTLITGIAWTPAPVCGVYATSDTGYATRLTGVQNAGSYVTHCSGGTSANYAPNTYVDGTFTINKAPATVTATPASSSYDVGVPSLTFTSSPTPISWITPPTCSAYATADSGFTTPLIGVQDVGSYATQCSGGVSVNYAPNAYGPATLTITKANATVIASSPVSIDYGFAAPAVTFTTSPTPITWTTEPTCGVYSTSDTGFANRLTGVQNAGTYVTHCSGGVSANYSAASFTSGSLTINKANATITASSPAPITFGANVSSVSYGTSPSPITWTSAPACGIYATTDTGYVTRLTGAQNAGAYVTHCSGGTSVNYAPNTYIDGAFTINTAPATVSATAASVAYGTSVPSVSFTTVPTPIVWDTAPTCAVYASSDTGYATALTGVQDAGSYVAHCAGAASSNFISPSYVDSNFTVTKAAATVNASSPSTVIHGVDVSSVTFTTSPSPIAWETEPTCAVYASTDTRFASPLSGVQDAGTYVTHCSGGVSLNYAPNSYIAGSFTIGKDSVEVTATSPADTIFGATLPTVSTTTNPTPITWTAAPTCGIYATTDTGYTTPLTGVQPAGSYVTHCSAGVSVNYAPSAYVDGALNIVKAPSVSTITCPTTALIATGSALAPCSVTITGAGGLSTTGTVVYTNNTSAGTATADYTYAGDVNHDGSTAAQVSFTIVNVSTVTRPTEPTMKTSIASRSALKLLTTVGSPAASLATTTPAVCVVKGSYVYFLVAGTCKVTVKQGGLVWKSYQTTVNPKTVRSTPTTAQKITSVLFAKGSSTLSAAAKKQLTALVTKFKAAKVVFVYGFVAGTVSSGTTAQKSLSLARANAVARYLISKGVTIVSAKGYGRQIAATPAKPTTAANDRADLGTA